MNNGKLVIVGIFACVIAGGLWMRSAASRQWDTTLDFYRGHRPTLARYEALHRRVREMQLAPSRDSRTLANEARRLAAGARAMEAPNGRTMRTQESEIAYAEQVESWAQELRRTGRSSLEASPSFFDLEAAYGALIGQVRMDDPDYPFKVPPAPGTMPTPKPRRII
ncbi:MAG TPA: hypothetical protein V6D00_05400 [Pantanalinema sp.]